MSTAKILVVDDDPDLAISISRLLLQTGYQVERVNNGFDALYLYRTFYPDLVLLDLTMPGMSGLDVCKQLRVDSVGQNVAIMMLTAHTDKPSIVASFEAGADDYVSKPFDFDILRSRVAAVLHRTSSNRSSDGVLSTNDSSDMNEYRRDEEPIQMSIAGLTLDTMRALAITSRGEASLTPNELTLLRFFMKNSGRIFSSQELLELVWNYPPDSGDPSLVRWHIKNLRRKIESQPDNPQYIRTVIRHGYLFDSPTLSVVSSSKPSR